MECSPYSSKEKGIEIGLLPGGYGYAFDFSCPSGVKLLPPEAVACIPSGKTLRQNDLGRFAGAITANPLGLRERKHLAVWLHVINGCNFACHYCYIPHLSRFVSRSEIEESSFTGSATTSILENLASYCASEGLEELVINFAGGEPTLNLPLVEQFCKTAQELNSTLTVSFGMISNGSFEASKLIPIIKRFNIRLSLSIDGYAESHDRIRYELENGKKRGSWDLITRNVDILVASGIRPYFLYTVTQSNYTSIREFSAYSHAHGLGYRLSLVRSNRAVGPDAQQKISSEICDLYDHLAETLVPDLPILRFAAFAEWNLYKTKYVPCSSCRNYFAIDTKGNVATCQMRMDQTYGSARDDSFANIVSRIQADPHNLTLSRPGSRNGVCIGCQFFHVCASGCPQHNANTYGIMDHQSPWCKVYGDVIPRYIKSIARQLQRAYLEKCNAE